MTPAVVVSLDFELRWGLLGLLGDDMQEYRRNLEGVDEVVPRLLEMFAALGVRATWATVGALACRTWDEWRERAPAYPRYRKGSLAWRPEYRRKDPDGRLHFARHLVDAVARSEGQELASHTFGHVYFREPGFSRDDAVADTEAALRVFEDGWGRRVSSLVFPRNQVAHVDVLRERGFTAWRINARPFYWNAATEQERTAAVRLLRLADSVMPLGRRAVNAAAHQASFFLRLTLPEPLWRLHRRRVSAEALGLRGGEALHLWFHPHNIGGDPARGVRRAAELLEAVRDAAPAATRFMSMGDVARESGSAGAGQMMGFPA